MYVLKSLNMFDFLSLERHTDLGNDAKSVCISHCQLLFHKAFFFFFDFFPFVGPLLWHMEVSRLGVESEL